MQAAESLYNLRLIPFFPFLGAAILILFGRFWRRQTINCIAIGSIAIAAAVTLQIFFFGLPAVVEEGGLHDVVWPWIGTGDLHIDLAFRMDALSGLLCLVVTGIGTLIHIFAAGYMEHDPDYARFFAYLNLFCGAMLVLVLGDSLPVMFVGWEGVGLCSYLLIGFWYSDNANASAGKKAFITNRIGDLGFLIGMFLLFQATGSLRFSEITQLATGSAPGLTAAAWLGMPMAFWIGLCLFIGATGKSAQIPLYVWLPDAMAGPTPVSALIHAATMVTAGVYMVARLHALYVLAPAMLAIVTLVGAATALFAAVIGFAQNDFKKVLAYSTVSQLGFMFVGVGTANFANGVFHLFTHAFFKAGLFLCAGSVMHAMSGSGDITKMGGLRKLTPWTFLVFFVCWLAISGVPPFSGFFSKDAIVAGAFATHAYGESLAWVGPLAGVMLLLAAFGTAFYMSRLYFLVFTGENRADHETQHHIHESPAVMVGPLVVLAIGAAVGGFLGFPAGLFDKPELNVFAEWLKPAVGPELEVPKTIEGGFMVVSTLLAFGGIGLAYLFYCGGYRQPAVKFAAQFPGLVRLVYEKFRVDELYDAVIIRPIRRLSVVLYQVVDRFLIDSFVVTGAAWLVGKVGSGLRRLQFGDSQRYLAVFVLGAGVIVFFATRASVPDHLKLDVVGNTVTVDAARPGRPSARDQVYEYDFDADGHPEFTTQSPTQKYTYDVKGKHTIRVTVKDERWHRSSSVETTVNLWTGEQE